MSCCNAIVGSTRRLFARFVLDEDDAIDSVAVVAVAPSGATQALTATLRPDGRYRALVFLDEADRWEHRWTATLTSGETVIAAKGFMVDAA